MRRRNFLLACGLLGVSLSSVSRIAHAQTLGPILGTVLDYAAGVPSAASIKAAGHAGVIRYVSDRRPGTESWMLGKPVLATETDALQARGLGVASVFQFGKGSTADWLGGYQAGVSCARDAVRIHFAAKGPRNRPIYAAIDDNPSWEQYDQQIRPYLQGFQSVLLENNLILGVYGNFNVIDWAVRDSLGSYFWQHDWGSGGKIHPYTTVHQKAGYTTVIDGVTCDVNNIYRADWGQWNYVPPAAPVIGSSLFR